MSNQFGGNQNPPWVRQDFAAQGNAAASMLQPSVSYPFTQAQQPSQFAPQQQIAGPGASLQQAAPTGGLLPQPGIALPTSLSASTVPQVNPVSYPVKSQAGTNSIPKQRMFTGSVTKMHDTFGFVDEEVFFQMSVVKGMIPKVGDRVLVEASYNANMPFKWNATRVVSLHDGVGSSQVMSIQHQQQQQQQQQHQQHQQQQNQLKAIQQQAMGLMGAGPLMSSNTQMLGGATPGLSGGQGLLSNPPGPPPLMTGLNKFQSGGMQSGVFNSSNNRSGVNTGPGLLGDPRPRSLLGQMKDQRNTGMTGNVGHGGGGRGGGGDVQKDRDRRDRERRDRRVEERRKRSRSPPPPSVKRSRSPASSVRSRSPVKRRPTRPTPRYVVQIPKILLDVTEASVMSLKAKYSNLYVPSDFFHTSFPWVYNFPLTRPFSLGQHCSFHIMHKEIPSIKDCDVVLEPNDADFLFSAKVMLMASPALEDLYKKSCCLAEDLPDAFDNAQHPARLLNFLVGTRGKNEPMAIGGPWSPSLDGANPQANPQVLIKTAIRTTKALTGIDLSSCTQWYRFTEIRYFRPESKHKDRLQPARVETVVIFLPDVWNCSPTHLEWNSLQAAYQKQLQLKLNPEMAATLQQEEEEEMEAEATEDGKTEPSHFSTLDPKTMKVGDLRKELELRNLTPKGLKSQLVARLAKVIKAEEEAEKASKEEEAEKAKLEEAARVIEEQKIKEKAKEEEEKDEAKKKEDRHQEEEKQRKEKREKAILERRYKLPDHPSILVHPSPTAKSGKFDCSVMSLSVLLDYRPEDNKEHSFEVSLFAELFNEMLMRDFGFQIYSAVALAPPKKEEDKKKEETKKDEKKEEKEKKDEDKKEKDQDKKDKKDSEKKEKKDQDKKEDKEGSRSPKRRKVDKDVVDGGTKEESPDKEKDKDEDHKSDKDKDEKKKKKDEEKKKTSNPRLLLAFSYFDQNHCGYLADKDVEDIIHTLGLKLSRAQIKKMVQKVLHHDSFKYRKMTDRSLNEKGEIVEEKLEDEDVPKIEPEQLARGNRESLRKLLELSGSKTEKTEYASSAPVKGHDDDRNFVDYKGSLLDIESLMQKLDRSEKSRAALEKTLFVTNDELKTVKSNLSESEKDNSKLSQELRRVKSDLEGEKTARTASQSVNQQWHQLATNSRNHIVNVLNSINTMLTSDGRKESNRSDNKKSDNEDSKNKGMQMELVKVKIEKTDDSHS